MTVNVFGQKVRDAFGPDFTTAADVIAEMLEVHISRSSPPVPAIGELAWKAALVHPEKPSREQLIEIMAICFWAARALPRTKP